MLDKPNHYHGLLVVRVVDAVNQLPLISSCRVEEAGTYLATYKAFEHRSPDLIKERQDKDYQSALAFRPNEHQQSE